MKSKTSFFNSSLFWNFNKRHWPLWVVYLAAMAIAVVLPIAMMDKSAVADYYISLGTIPFAFVLAFAAAFFAFRHLSSSTASVFYGSLPLKRTGAFATMFLAGFLPLIACNVAIVLIGFIASIGKFSFAAPALLAWFAMMSMADLIFYAMAVLCVQLTGISWMSGVIYAGVNILASALEALVVGILRYFIYGASFSLMFFQWASPLISISEISSVAISAGKVITSGWLDMGLYTLFGIACIIVAAVLYKRRKFERVSEIIAYKGLRPVFKYLMAVIFALGIGRLLFELCFNVVDTNITFSMTLALIAFMIIGGVMGYIATSMLVNKLARISKRDLIGAAIVAVCCVAFGLACYTDLLGVESRVPDASKVESVMLTNNGYGFEGGSSSEMPSALFTSEEGIESVTEAHRAILEDHENGLIDEVDPDSTSLWGVAHSDYMVDEINTAPVITWGEGETPKRGYTNITLTYKMKSGYTWTRNYNIFASTELFDDGEYSLAKLAKVCDSKEARESRYQLLLDIAEKATPECTVDLIDYDAGNTYSVLIKPSQVRELVSGPFKQDMEEADACSCDLEKEFTNYYSTDYENGVSVTIYGNDGGYATITVDEELTPNTYKWILENANPGI